MMMWSSFFLIITGKINFKVNSYFSFRSRLQPWQTCKLCQQKRKFQGQKRIYSILFFQQMLTRVISKKTNVLFNLNHVYMHPILIHPIRSMVCYCFLHYTINKNIFFIQVKFAVMIYHYINMKISSMK